MGSVVDRRVEGARVGLAGLSSSGERQTLSFPSAWQSADGLRLSAVWGCYGTGCGTKHHDRGNITGATLKLK